MTCWLLPRQCAVTNFPQPVYLIPRQFLAVSHNRSKIQTPKVVLKWRQHKRDATATEHSILEKFPQRGPTLKCERSYFCSLET